MDGHLSVCERLRSAVLGVEEAQDDLAELFWKAASTRPWNQGQIPIDSSGVLGLRRKLTHEQSELKGQPQSA